MDEDESSNRNQGWESSPNLNSSFDLSLLDFGQDAAAMLTTESEMSEAEASLVHASDKPASTAELKNMLKEAGTALTVKYLTGEITSGDFVRATQQRRQSTSDQQNAPPLEYDPKMLAKIHFDQLMEDKQNDSEDEEDDDDEEGDEDEDNDDEKGGAGEVDFLAQHLDTFHDSGATIDQRDEEWIPDAKHRKKLDKSAKATKGMKGKQVKAEVEKKPPKVKPRKKRLPAYEIPKHLSRLNGQAFLLRAQGKVDEAMEILFHIIQNSPRSAQPFRMLGSIHEEKGDTEQALKFYMVSANLRKSDTGEWFDLIDTWLKLENEKMALMCFSKAFSYAKTKRDRCDVLSRKIDFYQHHNYPPKTIMQTREQMIPFLDRTDPEAVLSYARSLANEFLEIEEMNGAISTYACLLRELPNHIDSEDVNALVELLMQQNNHVRSLEILFKHCGIEVEINGRWYLPEETENCFQPGQPGQLIGLVSGLQVPPMMSIDLKSKLLQCVLSAKVIESLDVIQDMLDDILECSVEEYGDVHYDIAETLETYGFHERAKPILQRLVKSHDFGKAAVWLTYGQCLNALGEIEGAAQAYSQVVEMAPTHHAARFTLSSLMQQMGYHETALQVLTKEPSQENEIGDGDQQLLLHKCELLESQGRQEEFIESARQLLSFNFTESFSPIFMKVLMKFKTSKCRQQMFPKLVSLKGSQEKDSEMSSDQSSDLQKLEQNKFREQAWQIYLKLCQYLHNMRRLKDLMEITVFGISCPLFSKHWNETRAQEAEFLCLKMCILSGSRSIVYTIARTFFTKELERNQACNLYCYIVTLFKNTLDVRFSQRAMIKFPDNAALGMINGSVRMMCGSYRPALGEFLSVFRNNPENDLALLCCSLCLIHLLSQSFASKRNVLFAQALCFMNAYKGLRGECQETYYNLGRAMHQLNVPFAAVHYYKKALELPPMLPNSEGIFDLTYETAHNLALLYRKSGNHELARYTLETYCVV